MLSKIRFPLSGWMLVFVVFTSLIVFPIVYFFTFNSFKSIIEKKVVKDSETIAKQTFNSMFQIMKRGWSRKDVVEFLHSLKITNENYEIEIYRTKVVEELFGKINQLEFSKEILKAVNTGKNIIEKNNNHLKFVFPLKAENICLKCHTNAKLGDVLGIIEVKANIKNLLSEAQKEFSKTLLMVIPIPVILVIIFGFVLTSKIKKNISSLNLLVEKIKKTDDLNEIFQYKIDFPLKEIDVLYQNIRLLAQKINKIAVDKEALEFEIKLLEKFILTSDIIKDWKNHILFLLSETNKIIPVYFIFSVFKDDDKLEVEIFWLGIPPQQLRKKVEKFIKDKLKEKFKNIDISRIKVNHNVYNPNICLFDNNQDIDLEIKIKSLFLEKPEIGGIVGIGIKPVNENSTTKNLVVEGILSTLLNVIGSVKAIYKYTRELEYYATRDPLTNLYNQRVFWELANYEVKRANKYRYKFSLLIIDLDNFKSINDTYGHDFGDKFLIHIANLLSKSVRPGDIIARYGGDEFIILFPETDTTEALKIAKKILSTAEKYYIKTPDNKKITPRFSIGISTYPDHSRNLKDLFSIADAMLYKAKFAGKGQVIVPTEEDIIEFYSKENELSITLNQIIENKNVIPYFQPIFDTKTDKIAAYEVLSRIKMDGKIMSAGEYIEVAEKTGLIFKLDLILLEKTFQKIKGRKEYFFINLTPKALLIPEYISEVNSLVKKYNIDPSKLVFEITERESVKSIVSLQRFIKDLKNLGYKFAIDDFGSGFSSFYYVKQLPVDFVKIEGEFIRNLTKNEKDKAFVESIVTLVHKLNIKTVAEFVDNEDVYRAVKKLGIDYAQGFYLGKPSPQLREK